MESNDTRPIHKILVANRGEIARRVFRTARDMGIATVAVYSSADRDAPHVEEADEAVYVGEAPSAESYLNQAAILSAAQSVSADAIHPGYGFLSENADFADACEASGLIFIGPSAESIRAMGDKARAKEIAGQAGVPVLDGFSVDDSQDVRQRVADLGLPVLIKATAGGGGKGMRAVHQIEDLQEAVEAAGREAMSAFGDDSLLIERLVESPRHVEVQVLADSHGETLHLFERDCSVQRRHQKVFEECPSPAVSPELRQQLGQAAVDLARAVGYRGAGTVEFLLGADQRFYFLEINTRLQVEHPVTEEVTGLDLVREQIRVARGEPLGYGQEDLTLDGHAVEARLYAEDPDRDFLPVTGRVTMWSVPELPGLRVDSGVELGTEIGPHYDPMLAKVIAVGRDRNEAVSRLRRGLQELAVAGPTTNRDFLIAALDHADFRSGALDTSFIERRMPPGQRSVGVDEGTVHDHAVVAALALFLERRKASTPLPAGIPSGWRGSPRRFQEQRFESGDQTLRVRYREIEDGHWRIGSGDVPEIDLRWQESADGRLRLELDGVRRTYAVAMDERAIWVHSSRGLTELRAVPRFPERNASDLAGGCVAPMTGKVIRVSVGEGDTVSAGDPLVVLEAMKMEHQLSAATDGTVSAVRVVEGQMVDPDQVMVVVEAAESGAKNG